MWPVGHSIGRRKAVVSANTILAFSQTLCFSLPTQKFKIHLEMANSFGGVSGRKTITHVLFDMDGLLLGMFVKHLNYFQFVFAQFCSM